jgi:endonuclease I
VRISRIIADLVRQVRAEHGDEWPSLLAEVPRTTDNPPHAEELLGQKQDGGVEADIVAGGNEPAEQDIGAHQKQSAVRDIDGPPTVTVTVRVGDLAPIVIQLPRGVPDVRKISVGPDATSPSRSDARATSAEPEPSNLVKRGLRNLERSQTRIYYEKERDKTQKSEYYRDIDPDSDSLFEELHALVTETHKVQLSYRVARIEHLYAWVDLQRDKKVRSIYSDERFNPKRFITEDFTIERRLQRVAERRLLREGNFSPEALERLTAALEAQEPFNCEHVVPQSWFGNDAPMQGDLHHLFTCQFQCNSFRGNRPYKNFGKFSIEQEADRPKCGFSEDGFFEPFMGKGKVARATLYFLVRYPGKFENMYEEVEDGLATLLNWHERTPVTEHERHRNQAIAEIQENRNPFIDHPEWASLAFAT